MHENACTLEAEDPKYSTAEWYFSTTISEYLISQHFIKSKQAYVRNLAAVIASSSVSEKQVWTSPVPQWSGAVACRRRMYRLSLSFSSRWTQAKMLVCVSSLFVRLKYRCRTKRLAELWLCAVTAEQNNLHTSIAIGQTAILKNVVEAAVGERPQIMMTAHGHRLPYCDKKWPLYVP